uniref:Drosha ribonuclease III n=1 Tax=Fundulus heteroclitus TaxID=8078 RepID=A0A3Q2NU62_FUNHE
MSFQQDRGGPRGGMPPGQHGSPQNYHPANLRPPTPQPPAPPYHYDPQTPPGSGYHGSTGFMPPHPDFMQYPPPAPSQAPGSLNQCPLRPPFPKPPPRGPAPGSQVSAQSAYHPYMMPPVPPPPLPHPSMPPPMTSQSMSYHPPYPVNYPPHPPFPPPPFGPGYAQGAGPFQPDRSVRHGGPYAYDKPMDSRRSPERGYRHDDHRQKGYGYSDRHKMEFGGERKDRGRSPDRRGRAEGGRYKADYDRGRSPPRHRSRERSRYRHRDGRRSQSPDRYRKRPRSRSASRDRKRCRWEEEKERRSESSSGPSRERSYSSLRSRDSDEAFAERERQREREKAEEEKEEEEQQLLKPAWIRCTHAESYYSNDPMDQVQKSLKAAADYNDSSSDSECESDADGSSCSSSSDSEVFDVIAEIKRKKAHPDRLHEELWYNDPGQMNDGPLCKCSAKARRTGIRHSIYPGEEPVKQCRLMSNNAGKLFHYRITVSPPTNFLTDRPTVIEYDDHEYLFEGFSLFSHTPLTSIPLCRVIRFNIDYTIHFIEEMTPENYCVQGLELFASYLFRDILELYDWNLKGPDCDAEPSGCQRFHFMPRFVRFLPDGGKEVLSMHQVLLYLLRSSKALVPEEEIADMLQWEQLDWQKYAEECKGMIVTNPGMVRRAPVSVALTVYRRLCRYQKLWKSYVKLRHLLANSPKVKQIDKQKLTQREEALQKIRQKNTMRREVTVELSSQGFWKTGIRSDVCQHAMMLPVLTHHIRYHQCLMHLDKLIGYVFTDRCLLQLAMTHPSHHLNFGMNPDHARNSLSNCGIRQPKYGDRKVHHMYMRKKGINTLINIMSRLGQDDPSPSRINHNERLEFLGDAVVEFLTSVHLYYLFPSLEEGGLATYRTAIVQNQHLAMLAKKLELDRFMLYAHGPDLCRESDLRHAMANCFEALIGAVYLEGGLEESRLLFGRLLFNTQDLREVWLHYPPHPLQVERGELFSAMADLHFISVRMFSTSFIVLGHNQRMEFLGDSIMQLVATEYLFIHFPDHHEGHLTLLRSSLVNNRTQAKVAEELGMQEYAITNDKTKRPVALRTKTLADLLECTSLYFTRHSAVMSVVERQSVQTSCRLFVFCVFLRNVHEMLGFKSPCTAKIQE